MHAFLALPIALATFAIVGQPLVRRAVRGLPRDVEIALGLALGSGVVASLAFLLSVLHVATRAGFLVALPLVAAVSLALGGKPRLPRGRSLRALAPIGLFLASATGLVLLQRAPQGAWTYDWAHHYVADVRYSDPAGMGDPEIGFGWSIYSRPPLFNLARVPFEALLGQSYAVAEAATLALALVLPAGAWLLLREIASPPRARAALALWPASAYWVHFAAYPKPTGLATGLGLAALALVLRSRRRPRAGLVPLAAALATFAGLAHVVVGLGLALAGGIALLRATPRERVASLLLVVGLSVPWPIWASIQTHGNLSAHDPVRRYFGVSALAGGLERTTTAAWNVMSSAFPVPLVAYGTAVARGEASLGRDPLVHGWLDLEITAALGAVSLSWLALALGRRKELRADLAHPRLAAIAFGLLALVVLVGGARILEHGVRPPIHDHRLRAAGPGLDTPCDDLVTIWLVPATALALGAVAFRLARARPEPRAASGDLVLGTALLQSAVALGLYTKAEYHGIAANALPLPTAILALWAHARLAPGRGALRVLLAAEGLATLLLLGVGGALSALPPDQQLEWKATLGLASLHDTLGPLAWLGVPLLLLPAWIVARGEAIPLSRTPSRA